VSPIGIVGFAAAGLLVVLWLVVSFMPRGPGRDTLEWTAACCMYLALLMLFVNLTLRARAGDSTLGLVAFGFLAVVFAGGLCVAGFQTLRSLRGGPRKKQASATN
jgi:hypothetical protein